MRDQYCKTGQGFLAVFSLSDKSSIQNTKVYIEYAFRIRDMHKVPLVIIGKKKVSPFLIFLGNKSDLERQVSKEEGEELAKMYGAIYIETSAKDSINVTEAFMEIVREIRSSNSDPSWWKKSTLCRHVYLITYNSLLVDIFW
jgi:GTPase SAR1 family protein